MKKFHVTYKQVVSRMVGVVVPAEDAEQAASIVRNKQHKKEDERYSQEDEIFAKRYNAYQTW